MRITGCLLFLLCTLCLSAQDNPVVAYKKLETSRLYLEFIHPPDFDTTRRYPAVIFFFGGGWNGGDRDHFRPQAEHLAERGLITILADYRTRKSHGTSPFEALSDAKSAMRYLRVHAQELALDTSRIGAGGGSAGGHLAVATALIDGYNEPEEDTTISTRPDALLLFNPVVDNGPLAYGHDRIGDRYPSFSPLHNIRAGIPPVLFLVGDADPLVPLPMARYFAHQVEKAGGRCDLIVYPGEAHGFFNFRNREMYRATLAAAEEFLDDLGWLDSN